MSRSAYERGTHAISINVTASEDAGGVPNLTYPYVGTEFGLPPYVGGQLPQRIGWHVLLGTPGSIVSLELRIEGSLDGTNWFTLDTYTTAVNTQRFITDKKVLYVRAKIHALDLTSGTSTTILIALAA